MLFIAFVLIECWTEVLTNKWGRHLFVLGGVFCLFIWSGGSFFYDDRLISLCSVRLHIGAVCGSQSICYLKLDKTSNNSDTVKFCLLS